jgi:hypothetical protein
VAVEEHGEPPQPQDGHHRRHAVADHHVGPVALEGQGQGQVQHAEDGAERRELAQNLPGQPVPAHLYAGRQRAWKGWLG